MKENIRSADIVRASHEDFQNTFGIDNPEDAYEYVKTEGCRFLFYTSGKAGVWFMGNGTSLFVPSIPVTPVSTIGAGDTFNADILLGIAASPGKDKSTLDNILTHRAKSIMEEAVTMATSVCMSMENYIPAMNPETR